MSRPPPALRAIFATPFASLPLPAEDTLLADLEGLIRQGARPEQRDPAFPADPLCFRSREDFFTSTQPPVGRLQSAVLGAMAGIMRAASAYRDEDFAKLRIEARARFSLIRPDGALPFAGERASSWTFIYCVSAPRPPAHRLDSGAVRLYDLRMRNMYVDAGNALLRPPFDLAHHIWQPTAGYMTAFPSTIAYEVALNRTDQDVLLVIGRARLEAPGIDAGVPW